MIKIIMVRHQNEDGLCLLKETIRLNLPLKDVADWLDRRRFDSKGNLLNHLQEPFTCNEHCRHHRWVVKTKRNKK